MKWLYGLATCAAFFACADTRTHDPFRAALQRVPAELMPGRIDLRVMGGRPRLVALPETHEILVSSDLLDADRSVWLHELAHFRLNGARPKTSAARRMTTAIEEGVADYFAATLEGSARIGDARVGIRDLARGPSISVESWASLGLSGFDSHHFGWAFAAELWRAAPRSLVFLTDLVTTLASDALGQSESPRAVFTALVAACPPRSRALLQGAIRAWVPAELHGFNNEESL